jgi:hypothetical protein
MALPTILKYVIKISPYIMILDRRSDKSSMAVLCVEISIFDEMAYSFSALLRGLTCM